MAYQYGGTGNTSPPERDAKQRIIDAAIELYSDHGFNGVTIKDVAAGANVSAPLVIHHFGSKAGLRKICDKYAAQRVYESKARAIEMGKQFTPEQMLLHSAKNRPILRYLVQALIAGGEEVDALMDQLVDDAVQYTAEAIDQELIKPSPDERRRAVMLLLQGFGSMMLHRQMKRLLGSSPMTDPPAEWGPYLTTIFDIYTNGVFEPEAYRGLYEGLAAQEDS
ncbi:TetR family transcriptional regulator [Nesterenkonia ebinurensis]|uniref:TetR family transcriptional regulator n=1 Tax=Nesterenkonia ebinurensis TaxID=2608252 RepID=UPI00123E1C9C|nr:TetR family transcriptional regulator [Nesterenkonia ebinurensis]